MNVGYVRLSRDDDRRNYVSIENQKLIISQYAASMSMTIDLWYEDDGVSGYKFDRPGFNQLIADLDKTDIVFVKDFSRIGRHNAKVLLLLDEFQERGKRLIVIDDNYDNTNSDDDVIGIKTWYNERYVKDVSKKIKSAIKARQIEGTFISLVPFGYKRSEKNKNQILIDADEAAYVRTIYDLYIDGSGYRRIAGYMTETGVPTPSRIRHEQALQSGKHSKRQVADRWTDVMVRDMLSNDFYIGTLRLHKRARVTIHGKDKKIPEEEHIVFEKNHPAIIDKAMFDLVQDIKAKRCKNNYRGSQGQWTGTEIPNLFGSCIYCKDCGSRLTPIHRKTSTGVRKYYICSQYNTKGRQFCSKSHLIEEKELLTHITGYIKLCRNALHELISTYDLKDFEEDKEDIRESHCKMNDLIARRKNELKNLLSQKIKDISCSPENTDLITESYVNLQNDLLGQIRGLEIKLKESESTKLSLPDAEGRLQSALDVIDNIIEDNTIRRRDIELLIERIEVTESGMPEIFLKHSLTGTINCDPGEKLNDRENQTVAAAMKMVYEEDRAYTSAKYLSAKLTEIGFKKSKKSVLPYLRLMIEKGILKPTTDPLKPYSIIKNKAEINELITGLNHNQQVDDKVFISYNENLHNSESPRRNASDGI